VRLPRKRARSWTAPNEPAAAAWPRLRRGRRRPRLY